MNRRDFLNLAGTGLVSCGCSFSSKTHTPTGNSNPQSLYHRFIETNDATIPGRLEKQEKRLAHKWHGGIINRYGIHTAGGTAGFIKALACAYIAPESNCFSSEALITPMVEAARYMLAAQHADGTIDLLITNFHSPPDTGFVLEHMCQAAGLLKQNASPLLAELKTDLRKFIIAAGDALSVGGIHTPNHRWVVCMALARVNSLYPDARYTARIDDWLGEKIDIDADGQFTEKSTSIYSPLTDRCLITIARLLDRPDLFKPVRENLTMTVYYVHPDGEVATECSRRQDQYRRGSMAAYYYPYRYMAIHDNNPTFSAMAHWIEKSAQGKLTGSLGYMLEDPEIRKPLISPKALPLNYTRVFKHSDLVRIRRHDISATILAKNPTFFSFRKGAAALEALRFASAFFGKGQFEGAALTIKGKSYVLQQRLKGPYYQPLPEDKRSPDGKWNKDDRSFRPQSEIQHLVSKVTITEQNGTFSILIEMTGTENVPVSVEFCFRHGGALHGVTRIPDINDAYLLEKEYGEYHFKGQVVRFGPGRSAHRYTQVRGALPKADAMSVYATGFTPFAMDFTVE